MTTEAPAERPKDRSAILALIARVGLSEASRQSGEPKTTLHRWARAAKLVVPGAVRNAGTEQGGTEQEGGVPGPVVQGAKGSAYKPSRDEVVAWMKANVAGPQRGARQFGVPTDVVRKWWDEERVAEAARRSGSRAGDPLLEDDGLTWEERTDKAIGLELLALATNGGDALARRARAGTIKELTAARAHIITIQKAKAEPDPEASAPPPDLSTPEGRAALIRDLVNLPPDILDAAREMQRGG